MPETAATPPHVPRLRQTSVADGTVRARASLVNLANRTLIAQRVFTVERPAPSPDARGAVTALSAASDDIVEGLLEWTGDRLKAARAK